MITSRISRKDAEENPYLIWNEFVHLVGLRDYAELSIEQRPAHLVYWYDNEVLNGGHLQYFENKKCEHLEETIIALGQLGALSYQEILRKASTLFLSRPRKRIDTIEEYVETAREEEFSEYDKRFYRLYKDSPKLADYLERHLKEHQANFVTIV